MYNTYGGPKPVRKRATNKNYYKEQSVIWNDPHRKEPFADAFDNSSMSSFSNPYIDQRTASWVNSPLYNPDVALNRYTPSRADIRYNLNNGVYYDPYGHNQTRGYAGDQRLKADMYHMQRTGVFNPSSRDFKPPKKPTNRVFF